MKAIVLLVFVLFSIAYGTELNAAETNEICQLSRLILQEISRFEKRLLKLHRLDCYERNKSYTKPLASPNTYVTVRFWAKDEQQDKLLYCYGTVEIHDSSGQSTLKGYHCKDHAVAALRPTCSVKVFVNEMCPDHNKDAHSRKVSRTYHVSASRKSGSAALASSFCTQLACAFLPVVCVLLGAP